MNTAMENTSATVAGEVEFVTFYVGNILIGADIRQVEEINRHIEVTGVPHSPDYVRGVINLRGEVVTVVDLRRILNLSPSKITKQTRTVVVHSKDEQIGLLIDRIADVIKAQTDEINPPPANISGVEGRFFKGVYKLETELLIILDIDAALAIEAVAR
ncbi:MAG: chemotaxis protein CheW [Planctomycetota bacterium]|nr:chemotaxis protein CheW [Planctomycetota bacterium]